MEYDDMTIYENGFVSTVKDGKATLADASGQPLLSGDYSYIELDESGRIRAGKTMDGLDVHAFFGENGDMLTGWKDFILHDSGGQLYLGRRPGDYPPGVTPPHDYSQKFALLDGDGNKLTAFRYSGMGGFHDGYQVALLRYYDGAGLLNRHGAEVVPTVFDSILLTDEGGAFVTISGSGSDGLIETYVGYFRIPDSFSEMKTLRPATVYLDGIDLFFESDPVIVNERTMVPMRKIFETLGATVDWDGSARTVSAAIGDTSLRLSIGSDIAYVNGEEIRLDAAPFIQNDITFVPLRFVSEASGAEVQWDDALRRALITRR
jgi:hypothetical protein